MVTPPPGPVYPVMVITPLLVVKVNWAWAAGDEARKTNASTQAAQGLRIKHNTTQYST
jgi:hypothetical protein